MALFSIDNDNLQQLFVDQFEFVHLLGQTLSEEKEADVLLSQIAENANIEAKKAA